MSSATLTQEEVRKAGLRALEEALVTTDMIRFLQLFETGSGNYTEERHQWLDDLDVHTMAEDVIRARQTGGGPDGQNTE